METLQEKITRLQNELDEINQKPEFTPDIIDRRNYLANQLAEAELELAKQGSTGEEVQAEAEPSLPADAITIDGETYLLRMFAKDEKNARALVSLVNVKLKSQEKVFVEQLAAAKDESAQEIAEQKDLAQSLKEQLAQAIMDKEDAEAKRDAASREIESLKAELAGKELLVSEKQEQIDKLRTEIAMGAPAAAREIKADVEDFKRQLREIEASLPAIYDVKTTDPLGIRHITFTAKLVETDEEISDNYAYIKGKYRVLEGDELSRFRDELAARKASEPVPSDSEPVQDTVQTDTGVTEETIPVPSFPVPNQDAGRDMDGNTADAEGTGEVSREEFEALKRRVDRLEGTRKEAVA